MSDTVITWTFEFQFGHGIEPIVLSATDGAVKLEARGQDGLLVQHTVTPQHVEEYHIKASALSYYKVTRTEQAPPSTTDGPATISGETPTV